MIQTMGEYIEQDANFFYFRTYNSYCSSNSSFFGGLIALTTAIITKVWPNYITPYKHFGESDW